MLLPVSTFAEITSNLAALQLEPAIATQILSAILAPLLHSKEPSPPVLERRASRLRKRRSKSRSPSRRKRKMYPRSESRERARAAIAANPDATLARIAKIARCAFGTAVSVRKELRAEAKKQARKEACETTSAPIGDPKAAAKAAKSERAQKWLRDALSRGPRKASDVEEAAAKVHVDDQALTAARAELGIVTSRANTGGPHAVQWSLPG